MKVVTLIQHLSKHIYIKKIFIFRKKLSQDRIAKSCSSSNDHLVLVSKVSQSPQATIIIKKPVYIFITGFGDCGEFSSSQKPYEWWIFITHFFFFFKLRFKLRVCIDLPCNGYDLLWGKPSKTGEFHPPKFQHSHCFDRCNLLTKLAHF